MGDLPGVEAVAAVLATEDCAFCSALEDEVDVEAFPFCAEIERELDFGVVGAEVNEVVGSELAVFVYVFEHVVAQAQTVDVADSRSFGIAVFIFCELLLGLDFAAVAQAPY